MDAQASSQSAPKSAEYERYEERYAQRLRITEEKKPPGMKTTPSFGAILDTYNEEGELSRGVIGEIFAQSQRLLHSRELAAVAGSTIAGGVADFLLELLCL